MFSGSRIVDESFRDGPWVSGAVQMLHMLWRIAIDHVVEFNRVQLVGGRPRGVFIGRTEVLADKRSPRPLAWTIRGKSGVCVCPLIVKAD